MRLFASLHHAWQKTGGTHEVGEAASSNYRISIRLLKDKTICAAATRLYVNRVKEMIRRNLASGSQTRISCPEKLSVTRTELNLSTFLSSFVSLHVRFALASAQSKERPLVMSYSLSKSQSDQFAFL